MEEKTLCSRLQKFGIYVHYESSLRILAYELEGQSFYFKSVLQKVSVLWVCLGSIVAHKQACGIMLNYGNMNIDLSERVSEKRKKKEYQKKHLFPKKKEYQTKNMKNQQHCKVTKYSKTIVLLDGHLSNK